VPVVGDWRNTSNFGLLADLNRCHANSGRSAKGWAQKAKLPCALLVLTYVAVFTAGFYAFFLPL
jgi:hypothetical protein